MQTTLLDCFLPYLHNAVGCYGFGELFGKLLGSAMCENFA